MSWLGCQIHWIQALVFLISRVWVRVPVLTLNHHSVILWIGRKSLDAMCYVMHVKELEKSLEKTLVHTCESDWNFHE